MLSCVRDVGRQRAVRELCKHDLLFWLNAFGWTFNAKPGRWDEWRVLPFITYPFQDELFRSMEGVLGKKDLVVVKSRQMGVTWCVCALFLQKWQFARNMSFGMVSRKEDLVDGTPKALFTKIQFMLDRQPRFLVPEYDHFHMRFLNKETKSTIEGSATTGSVFRGDNYTATAHDELSDREVTEGMKELAASQFATNSRIFFSTPQGAVGAFYEVAHNKAMERMDLPWRLHPEYGKDALLDGGKWTSPWYRKECKRLAVSALIAQELDLDFAGSASPFFGELLVSKVMEDVRRPYMRGRLEFDPQMLDREGSEHIAFLEDQDGDFLLWSYFKEGRPAGNFVVGTDISAGTGATNSVLSVADRRTGEKVAEFATANLSPDRFAEAAVAACRFFNGAYLLWEMNGPGGPFGRRVIDLGYRNVYYRQNEQSLSRKMTDTPGWFASRDNRRVLFGQYASALQGGRFINRSEEAIKELRSYVYLPTGDVGNARATAIADPSGARDNHGDRVTADALANKGLADLSPEASAEQDQELNPPVGSLAWRRREREQSARKVMMW